MEWLVRLVGLVMVGVSAVYVSNIVLMKKVIRYWIRKKRRYTAAVINIAISVVMLLAATRCRLSLVVALVGVLSLLKGIFLITAKEETFSGKMNALLNKPDSFLRFLAVFGIVLGLFIIYSAMPPVVSR